MKLIVFLFILLAVSCSLFADDTVVTNPANVYEQATIPNFLPHVGKALAGRCYLAKGSNKKIATVLMVSFDEEGFEVAPFDLEKTRDDIFDNMSYEDVLKKYPQVKKMYLDVSETADGAVVETTQGNDDYRGEIRESEKYFIMRVFINQKLYKYCNYIK